MGFAKERKMKIQLSVAVFVAVFAATVLANPGGAPFPVNPIGDTDITTVTDGNDMCAAMCDNAVIADISEYSISAGGNDDYNAGTNVMSVEGPDYAGFTFY